MRAYSLCLYVIFLSTLFACKTDIDVNADYKDITIVYGVIDPLDSVHYIKINKSFLQDGFSAEELASSAGNFNYAENELEVTMEERHGTTGNLVTTYSLTRVENEVPKDGGIFDNSVNVLYKFVEPDIEEGNLYKLRIYNKVLDKEVTSETEIVKKPTITSPATTTASFEFKNQFGFSSTTFGVFTGKDVGRIKGVLVFNYKEVYTNGDPARFKSIEMAIGEKKTDGPTGGDNLDFEFNGATLFDNITEKIDPNTPFLSHRELRNISLKFILAGTTLNTFMEVNEPTTSINQTKPNYTNITNGIGLFSSRSVTPWVSSINTDVTKVINIRNATITELRKLGLGFCFGTQGTGFPVAPCP